MVSISYWPVAIALLFTVAAVQSQAQTDAGQPNKTPSTDPYNGQQFAEQFVIVESNLSVRQKTPTSSKRITREAPLPSLIISRIKRQFQSQPNVNKFGSSQSTAQSNSHAHDFGPFGFQTADALAGAQVFQNNQFGASSNNAASLNQGSGPFGQMGGASFSGGQAYSLPNGQTLNIAYNNGFSNGPNGLPSTHKGSAISFSG